jgi:hypothetical protein
VVTNLLMLLGQGVGLIDAVGSHWEFLECLECTDDLAIVRELHDGPVIWIRKRVRMRNRQSFLSFFLRLQQAMVGSRRDFLFKLFEKWGVMQR